MSAVDTPSAPAPATRPGVRPVPCAAAGRSANSGLNAVWLAVPSLI